jgi:hypothetical protein
MTENECQELIFHHDRLHAVLKATNDAQHREALERAIVYLGNRMAILLEPPSSNGAGRFL